MARLSDDELDEALAVAQSLNSLRLTAAIAAIPARSLERRRERRRWQGVARDAPAHPRRPRQAARWEVAMKERHQQHDRQSVSLATRKQARAVHVAGGAVDQGEQVMHGMDTDEELVYWRERAKRAEEQSEQLRKALEEADFEKAWQAKVGRGYQCGYQYGEEELSLVEFGFEIAVEWMRNATQKDGGR